MPKAKGPIHSPMTPDLQANPNHRTPSTKGTSEVIEGSAPKAAPVHSPTEPKVTSETKPKSQD